MFSVSCSATVRPPVRGMIRPQVAQAARVHVVICRFERRRRGITYIKLKKGARLSYAPGAFCLSVIAPTTALRVAFLLKVRRRVHGGIIARQVGHFLL